MSSRKLSVAQLRQLAAHAGLAIASEQLPATAKRMEAFLRDAAGLDCLPLQDSEPAIVFRLEANDQWKASPSK